jgi:N-acetyl-1-D-myo-inositol-2-amino-2-deoxy-alpha-D-glucopyranoside deacetylase
MTFTRSKKRCLSRDALSGATCPWPEPRASTARGRSPRPRAEARGSCCLSAILLAVVFLFLGSAFAADDVQSLSLSESDRVLVLAPHPDDEAIATAGVLQKAQALHIPVKIVYLTNGDNNELAFLVYKKRPILSRNGLLKMGELRRQEATKAMKDLGFRAEQLVFLGYPDFGTLNIFVRFWGEGKAYRSLLTRVTSVPYSDSLNPEAPYKGESILADMKQVLLDFKPTKIFVSHPADTNGDHRALFLFLQVALWDLDKKLPTTPQIYPYLVHVAGWPKPRGFNPELRLDIPPKFVDLGLSWNTLELTPGEIERKKDIIGYYKTQIEYNPKYLVTFARKNELFSRLDDIRIKDLHLPTIDWRSLEVAEHIEGYVAADEEGKDKIIKSLTYAVNNKVLYVQVRPKEWVEDFSEMDIFLLGYKQETPFRQMPKYRIRVARNKKVTIFEKRQPVFIRDIKVEFKGSDILISCPLKVLENPECVLSSARTRFLELPVDATAWRVLRLE